MFQFSEFFVRNPAECFVRVLMTADPCAARFADVTLGAVGAPVDLRIINEFSWISTIRAALFPHKERIIVQIHSLCVLPSR